MLIILSPTCPQAVMVVALAPWTLQSPLPAASNKQCVLTREATQVSIRQICSFAARRTQSSY